MVAASLGTGPDARDVLHISGVPDGGYDLLHRDRPDEQLILRWLRDNGIATVFLGLTVIAILGEAFVGHRLFNEEQLAHRESTVGFWRYLASSDFGARIMENWQSEFLQFATFIIATVWLIQRGSSESKAPGEEGGQSDEEQKVGEHAGPESPRWARVGGIRQKLYENSLFLVMLFFFFMTWFAQSVTARNVFNDEQSAHGEDTLSWLGYVGTSDFWDRTLQNWQSEFLAVGTMAIFAVYLRQRGSPESKPVGAAHHETTR
jgi:hypothetical protein